MITDLVVLVIILVLNGWFSTLESAYFAVNTGRLKLMAEAGHEKAVSLEIHMKQITKISAALRVGIVLTTLLIGALTAISFGERFNAFLIEKGLANDVFVLKSISVIVVTVVVAYFVLVFGEMVPKRIGIKHAEKIAMRTIGATKLLMVLTSPLAFLFRGSANGIARMLGIDISEVDARVTEEEIRMMVDAGGDNGTIDENEKEMINNIFELDNTSVGDIATHRTDIVAIPLDANLEDVTAVINKEKYSRIPVYDENIDNIVGVFHVKDMVKYVLNDRNPRTSNEFHIEDILMKPHFVPFSKKTDELFQEMQKQKVHMVIVIDEYGGTAGIVTMEDIMEEIVGNIFDEYDTEEEEDICYIDDEHFLINGTTDLSDVEELLEIVFEDGDDYDTLGGYLIGQLGRIPDENEMPEVTIDQFIFKIKKIEEKRIDKIMVSKI